MIVNASMASRLSGSPCILLLDIDGTLAPIAPRPSEARIPETTRQVLRRLSARPEMRVALVSGRSAGDARKVAALDDATVWVIGNHGIEIADPTGGVCVHPGILPYEPAVAAAAIRTGVIAREVPGTVVEDKRWTLSVHYRLVEHVAVPELLAAVNQVANEYGLRLTQGKRVIELRPPVPVDKGTACVELSRRIGGMTPGSSGLCAGDDQTDEDAFAALRESWPDAVTIRVGAPENGASTRAEWVAENPASLLDVLDWLLAR
jgi:trehalose-phosphatase